MHDYNAVIIGARVAGAAAAFALAQRGWKVALVERKARPLGPTLSLPIAQPRALARFRDLGLLPVIESILPQLHQVRSYKLSLTPDIIIEGDTPAFAGFDYGVILRREVLDDALLSFALHAYPDQITFFEQTNLEALLSENGTVNGAILRTPGQRLEVHTPLIVGADGRFSSLARLLHIERYRLRHSATTLYYRYCRGIDMTGLPDIVFYAVKENRLVVFSTIGDAGLQTVSVWFPVEQFPLFQRDPLREMQRSWQSSPELAQRLSNIRWEGKIMGLAPQGADGYFRPAGGNGWALVGDARHYKDPASGQGLHDALFSVQELLATLERINGGHPLTEAQIAQHWPQEISQTQKKTDRALSPMYAFTYSFASSLTRDPSLAERALLREIAHNPHATRAFLGIMSGATRVQDFNRVAPLFLLRGLLRH
jgi:2-polyprenyl-6-methoxyphenol hydroxylase-like FAD-dependent oxidoreductase